MSDDLSIGGIGLNLGTILVTVAVAWGMNKQGDKHRDEKLKEHDDKINKLFDLRDKHEEEANKERLLLHQNISKLEGIMEFRGRENIEIMKRVEKIDTNVELMKNDLAYLKVADKNKNA